MLEYLQNNDFSLGILIENAFLFKILNNNVKIFFSDYICDFLGLPKEIWHTFQSPQTIFFHQSHFFDLECSFIGIQTNFAYNSNMGTDCLAIFSNPKIEFGEYFQETIISHKQMLSLKLDVLEELEFRYLNLATQNVFKSFSNCTNDYIILNLCISRI